MRTAVRIVLGLALAHAFSPMQPRLQQRGLPAARAVAPRPAVLAVPSSPAKACRHHAPLMETGPFSETPVRSFVKAAGWRFTAGVVTAITSMIYTGSLETAAAIVGWDLFSKSITMFLGERLWNNVQWGREETGDSAKRSLAKAIAWRIFAACNTFFAAIVLNKGKEGAMGVAGKIAGTDSVFKTILFYFYERVWAIVSWGKEFEKAPKAEEA